MIALECGRCKGKVEFAQTPKFFYCQYCGYLNKEPEPPTFNTTTFNTVNQTNYNTYQSPEPSRISRINPKTGRVTYRDEEPTLSDTFSGLVLFFVFIVDSVISFELVTVYGWGTATFVWFWIFGTSILGFLFTKRSWIGALFAVAGLFTFGIVPLIAFCYYFVKRRSAKRKSA